MKIVCLQTVHYLLMSMLVPPVVSTLTSQASLEYSGGPYGIAYIVDWREMASRSTAPRLPIVHIGTSHKPPMDVDARETDVDFDKRQYADNITTFAFAPNSLNKRFDEPAYQIPSDHGDFEIYDYGVDRKRGWLIGAVWLIVCLLEWVEAKKLIPASCR